MRASLYLPTLLIGLLLVLAGGGASPARAGDEAGAAVSERWTYTKGEERRELDVSHMSTELRIALDTQLQATGWKRTTEQKSAAAAPDVAAPDVAVSESTAQDIAELIRRGGKLPEGYVPHGVGPTPPSPRPTPPQPRAGTPPGAGAGVAPSAQMMQVLGEATGGLLLRYLEVKDDPVKGPVYEEMLRLVGTQLKQGGAARPTELGMSLMATVMGGLQDPVKAPAYREMLTLFSPAIAEIMQGGGAPTSPPRRAPPAPGRPPEGPGVPGAGRPAPAELPFGGQVPHRLGGALLAYSQWLAGSGAPGTPSSGWAVIVAQVPPKSTAAAGGLREGDRIEAVDGKPVDAPGLRRAAAVLTKGGQLTLRLRRRDGQIEQLEMDVQLED